MGIQWDPDKERLLREERGIEIRDIADMIVNGEYLEILENPRRPTQFLFIVRYRDYTHAVPFVIDEDENIVLKTVYPSRKFHKRFGAAHEDET